MGHRVAKLRRQSVNAVRQLLFEFLGRDETLARLRAGRVRLG